MKRPRDTRKRRADLIGTVLIGWALLFATVVAFGWLYAYAMHSA